MTEQKTPAPEAAGWHAVQLPGDLGRVWSPSNRFVPQRFIQPVLAYMRTEAAGGIVMLVAAVVALAWANSPWGAAYEQLWNTPLDISLGGLLHIEHTLREWVNDALMVIFFFVVGLEIKREIVVGELSDPRAMALPALGALGGMVVPAAIYLALNGGTPGASGWGIPMATDIAFAVGVISLVGTRVPIGAKLFLLALAIVDDLGAILVIAIFYTDQLSLGWLAAAASGLVVTAAMRRMQVRSIMMYLMVGAFVWLATLESGVHATLAGVALALLTPVGPLFRADDFTVTARTLVDEVGEYAGDPSEPQDRHTTERIQSLLRDIRRLSAETVSPLNRLEHHLTPWSSFVVVPVFAFANAGVRISGDAITGLTGDRVMIGVFLGLLVGKVVGVIGASWLAVRTGLGRLPYRTTWWHLGGVGVLAGIGFTVALFVTALAFDDPGLADSAKIGIFAASLVAGILGFVWLRLSPAPHRGHERVAHRRGASRPTSHVTRPGR